MEMGVSSSCIKKAEEIRTQILVDEDSLELQSDSSRGSKIDIYGKIG